MSDTEIRSLRAAYLSRLKSNPWAQYLKRRKHQLKESENE